MKVCEYVSGQTGDVCGREVDRLVKGACFRCYHRELRPLLKCPGCDAETNKHKSGHCYKCYTEKGLYSKANCNGCGKLRRIRYKGVYCVTCYVNHVQPEQVCFGCGQSKKLRKGDRCARCSLKFSKFAAFRKLGGICVCCHEHDLNLLTVDHVNKDGAAHRKELGGNHSRRIYQEILASEGPISRYQLLCWSCNSGRQVADGGICHDHYRREALRRLNDSSRPLNP
jgi:hypothetical protein